MDCLSGEEDEEEDDEKPEKPDTLATGMENGYEYVDLGLSVKWRIAGSQVRTEDIKRKQLDAPFRRIVFPEINR